MPNINMSMLFAVLQFSFTLLLGYVFFMAGYHKLIERDRFAQIIREYEVVPIWAEKPTLYVLGLIEVTIFALLLSSYSGYAALVAMALLVLYIAVMGRALILGKRLADCGCGLHGDKSHEIQLSVWLIVRNLVLIALAASLLESSLTPSLAWLVSVPLALFFIGFYVVVAQIHQNQIKLNYLEPIVINLLIVSNVLLWMCVLALICVVFALLRQVGVLYERVAPAGALMMNKILKVGDVGPVMDVKSLSTGNALSIAGKRGDKKNPLLFFLDSKCPVCKTLLPALKSASYAERSWLNIILVGDADESTQQKFIKEHSLGNFEFANSDTLGRQYGVSKLPFAVLLDDAGVISSMGLINSREHIESLFEAKERGVASIQEYLQSKDKAEQTAIVGQN